MLLSWDFRIFRQKAVDIAGELAYNICTGRQQGRASASRTAMDIYGKVTQLVSYLESAKTLEAVVAQMLGVHGVRVVLRSASTAPDDGPIVEGKQLIVDGVVVGAFCHHRNSIIPFRPDGFSSRVFTWRIPRRPSSEKEAALVLCWFYGRSTDDIMAAD